MGAERVNGTPGTPATLLLVAFVLAACGRTPEDPADHADLDVLITGGMVFSGRDGESLQRADVGIRGDRIVRIGDMNGVSAATTLDASGSIVTAGFIDPHTHSLSELLGDDTKANLNYLHQGVTTVFNGNDGGGPVDVAGLAARLTREGIGTNTALYVGHGELRLAVMNGENRAPTATELETMAELVRDAMRAGALGLSTGLFYAPGSYSATEEVIELARAAAEFDGVYDSHLRDESNYNIGVLAALEEAITIGREAGIQVHIAHIKALGVDVWGESREMIEAIESARASGLAITADQYPWRASGTHMRNALLPKHLLEGGPREYIPRLRNAKLSPEERAAVRENLRRRGGPESLLVVVSPDRSIVGRTLAEIAAERGKPADEVALDIIRRGSTRVASFNMQPRDVEAFMVREWVMTSSDGTDGHPRKYASFPEKYRTYVRQRGVLSVEEFLYRSSALTAKTFGLEDRGCAYEGCIADLLVFDPGSFAPSADFSRWDSLSTGVRHLLVNGQATIRDGEYTGVLAGQVLRRGDQAQQARRESGGLQPQ